MSQFDGARIINGDIVSPSPKIRIELRDDNNYFLLNEKESFVVELENVNTNELVRIDLDASNIIFYPADSTMDENLAVLEFYPEFDEGLYTLYVQAEDMSGNKSGDQSMSVTFRVIAETRVSNVVNYPNPFSNTTQFEFVITGNELPEVFSIQIMNMSGRTGKRNY